MILLPSIHFVHRISLTISIRCKGFRVWLRHAWDSLWKSYTQTDWSNKKKCANERAGWRVARDKWQDLVKSVIHNSKSCVWIGAWGKWTKPGPVLWLVRQEYLQKENFFTALHTLIWLLLEAASRLKASLKQKKQARSTEQVEGKRLTESVNTSQHKT